MTDVRTIMTKRVVAVRPETTLADAVALLTEHHIGGAPVVDAAGCLVGVISEMEMIDVIFDADARSASVSQYMTCDVQVVAPSDSLPRVAQLFALYSFCRLPVVDDGKLIGIVSRRDLMNHALRSNELLCEPLVELIPTLAPMS